MQFDNVGSSSGSDDQSSSNSLSSHESEAEFKPKRRFRSSNRRQKSQRDMKLDAIYGVFLNDFQPSFHQGNEEDAHSEDEDTSVFNKLNASLTQPGGVKKNVKFVSQSAPVIEPSSVSKEKEEDRGVLSDYSSSSSDLLVSESDDGQPAEKPKIGRDIFRKKKSGVSEQSGAPKNAARLQKQYGVGFKMIQKMGFVGGGLGAEGQGVTKPIEVVKREKFKGLNEANASVQSSKVKSAPTPQLKKLFERIGDESDKDDWVPKKESRVDQKRKAAQLRKERREALRKKYLQQVEGTPLQMVIEGQAGSLGAPSPPQPIRIIDMRGPETTVISGEKSIGQVWRPDTPLDIADDSVDVGANWRPSWYSEADKAAQSVSFKWRLKDADTEAQKIKRIQKVQEIVQTCLDMLPRPDEAGADNQVQAQKQKLVEKYTTGGSISIGESLSPNEDFDGDSMRMGGAFKKAKVAPTAPPPETVVSPSLTMTVLTEKCKELKKDYMAEVKELGILSSIATSLLQPVLRKEAQTIWDLRKTKNPSGFLKVQLFFWRSFLSADADTSGSESTEPLLSSIVWEAVVRPHIMPFVEKEWNVMEECELMLSVCHDWVRVWTSARRFKMFMGQIIVPKLELALRAWDPTGAELPPHLWIQPWLPMLGDELLSPLMEILVAKYIAAFKDWDPRDRSGGVMVIPWKEVWTTEQVKSLVDVAMNRIYMFLGSCEVS
eukprot:Blabericola_migrator_1__1747@NODE_146_length_12961_cov_103_787110_g127_i0_p2_GENE_NODE_146_length_12961_cov_103_787110_g127_i0NODE_146_length_12961_cov_103_787110_g127_i0_p2_ORF_typecomplete_len716_score141_58GCFC/PF07842_12/2_1e27Gpatch/PF01585_23/2_1e09NDUF_B4/PF07225_12/0_86_NODE_146_length_12961_cov_103_787110_g127_i027994946